MLQYLHFGILNFPWLFPVDPGRKAPRKLGLGAGRVGQIPGLRPGGGGRADLLPVHGLHSAGSGCGTLQTGGWGTGHWNLWTDWEKLG